MKAQWLRKLALALAVAALSLSACAPAATPTAPPPAATAALPTATAAPQPVTLNLWWLMTSSRVQNAVDQALDRYMQDHPNIKIETTYYSWSDYTQAMPAALAAGNPPDLSFGDPTAPNLPNYVAAGQVVDLTDIIRERGWDDKLQAGVLTFYNPLTKDRSYGVPLYMAHRGIFYNKAILQELGADVPQTLDELEAILEQAKAKGYIPLGMGNADKYGADYYWLNLTLLYLANEDWQGFAQGTMKHRPDVPWGGEAVRKGMEKFMQWVNQGYFNPDFASLNSGDVYRLFVQGNMFAYSNDSNENDTLIAAQPDFEVGFFNWPRVYPDKPLLTISDPGLVLILPTESRHPQQALEVIDWLLSPEVGRIFAEAGLLPLHKADLSTVPVPAPYVKEELEALPAVTPMGWLNYMAPAEFPDKQGSELQKLLAGQTDLEQYLKFLQDTYDKSVAGN